MENTQEKLTYEQLENAYSNLVKAYEERKAEVRLHYDLEVIKMKKEFPTKYVKAAIKDVMTILEQQGIDVEKELSKKKSKETEE